VLSSGPQGSLHPHVTKFFNFLNTKVRPTTHLIPLDALFQMRGRFEFVVKGLRCEKMSTRRCEYRSVCLSVAEIPAGVKTRSTQIFLPKSADNF